LEVFRYHVGGEDVRVATTVQAVPLVRIDRRYRIDADVAGGDGVYDATTDVLLSDGFWWQDRRANAGELGPRAVEAGWVHREQFNAAFGDGSVRAVRDDGTIAANSMSVGGERPGGAGRHDAAAAERVWQFMDLQ
jgi:prepilin-type processing-associated H-X9-DG protein